VAPAEVADGRRGGATAKDAKLEDRRSDGSTEEETGSLKVREDGSGESGERLESDNLCNIQTLSGLSAVRTNTRS